MAASPSIAIVDDDPAVLKALSRLLRSRGFRVRTYGSGQELLAALPVDHPECLIVDLQMPNMNGAALHHLVNSGTKILIVLLTADGDAPLHESIGGGDFAVRLRKPVQEKCLFSAIDRAMGWPGSAGATSIRLASITERSEKPWRISVAPYLATIAEGHALTIASARTHHLDARHHHVTPPVDQCGQVSLCR